MNLAEDGSWNALFAMLANLVAATSAFVVPAAPAAPSLRGGSMRMALNPLDAVASPLRKFEPQAAAGAKTMAEAAASNNMLADAPIEVYLLFGTLIVVGIAALVKSAGGLPDLAPTVGLGESREELKAEADEAVTQSAEDMTQSAKEQLYFKEIASDLSQKRGGDSSKRKKKRAGKR